MMVITSNLYIKYKNSRACLKKMIFQKKKEKKKKIIIINKYINKI